MIWIRTRRALLGAAAGVLLLGACGYDATVVPKPDVEESSQAAPAVPVECDNATESYASSGDRTAALRELTDRGQLVVGVSADTLKLGSANPFNKSTIEGFDIDVAKAIAGALGVQLKLRVIVAADRIKLLKSGDIDIVARNMTMNCARWTEIGFSAVYYNATQKVLVRKDADGRYLKYKGPQDLAGLRVCAPAGSTSIDNITRIEPDAVPVAAANHTGCLIKFQNGEVEAITGDDTVLAGLVAQDKYAVVPDQQKLTDEPYGIGANKDDVDLIRFINSVLDERRSNGAWQSSYNTWLKPYLGDASAPAPKYGR
ncbi:glutamate ABC transporter substrate-binding protein [Nocardioides sp. WS12]|uniref:glutamate ABC transporter substrate-binding protein n=1 Tax=Nocardioides sp. WS12 TaxID=2486272 RepID=UPI0015FA197C|nr:glutamate ABC transporter substrate-binding protein [Nocardioides sp. WS12]